MRVDNWADNWDENWAANLAVRKAAKWADTKDNKMADQRGVSMADL